MKIEQININGLFNEYNFKIPIKDNKLILVAENGSGKTTIVNIIYFLLTKQWNKLLRYKFHNLEIIINGKHISLDRSEMDILHSPKIKKYLRRYPENIKDKLFELLLNIDPFEIIKNPFRFEYISDRFGIPSHLLFELSNILTNEKFELFNDLIPKRGKELSNIIDCQILYLPTYRRIEQDLKNIFPDLESDIDKYRKRRRHKDYEDSNYIELVEFGMEDVDDKITRRLYELRENLNDKLKSNLTGGYLKDVINRAYSSISFKQIEAFKKDALSSILDRIDEIVLSKQEKTKLIEFVADVNKKGSIDKEENKIIAYFIYRLSEIYNELMKEEEDIKQFISICNEFSGNKRFVYDNINFKITIHPFVNGKIKKKEEVFLKDLSSGEKQIVSLFSHIYLSRKKKFFVIIDEPELSLSVPWQQRFLVDIVNNKNCDGIIAVTHSPFIFDNDLEAYAGSLNSFITN